jgi:hypothetical protein
MIKYEMYYEWTHPVQNRRLVHYIRISFQVDLVTNNYDREEVFRINATYSLISPGHELLKRGFIGYIVN